MFLVEKTYKLPKTMGDTLEAIGPMVYSATAAAIARLNPSTPSLPSKDEIGKMVADMMEDKKLIYTNAHVFTINNGDTCVLRSVSLFDAKETYVTFRQYAVGLPEGMMESELDLSPDGIDASIIYEDIAIGKQP